MTKRPYWGSISIDAPGYNLIMNLGEDDEGEDTVSVVFRGREMRVGEEATKALVEIVVDLAVEHDGIAVRQIDRWHGSPASALGDAVLAAEAIGLLEVTDRHEDCDNWRDDPDAVLRVTAFAIEALKAEE